MLVEFRKLTKYKQQETFRYILDKLGMAYIKKSTSLHHKNNT